MPCGENVNKADMMRSRQGSRGEHTSRWNGTPVRSFRRSYYFRLIPVLAEKVCLECADKIVGRTDKRFCSDACRNLYHYHANNAPINYVRNVVNALKRNRRVLSELNHGADGKTKVHRDKLLERGYSFTYHTNTHRTKAGNTYVFCFEQGYLELGESWFMLVRRDEYLGRAGDLKKD